MAIDVQCGQCGKQFRVKDELAGKRVKCSQCGQPMAVPAAAGRPAPPSAAAPARPAAVSQPVQPATTPSGSLHELIDDATVGAVVAPTLVMPGQMLCQSCGKPIPMGAAMCTYCGYDFRAGKTTKVVRDKPSDPRVQSLVAALIALAIMVGANLLAGAVLGIGWFCWDQFDLATVKAPWRSLGISLAFLGGVFAVLFNVSLLADAFKEGWLRGLMFLFVPGYSLYFIATRWKQCRKAYFIVVAATAMLLMGLFVMQKVPAAEDEEEKDKRFREPAQLELPADHWLAICAAERRPRSVIRA